MAGAVLLFAAAAPAQAQAPTLDQRVLAPLLGARLRTKWHYVDAEVPWRVLLNPI